VKEKERSERDFKASKIRFAASTDENEEAKEKHALAAARAKIEARKSELEQEALVRQRCLEEKMAASLHADEAIGASGNDDELARLAEEGRKLEHIVQERARKEQETNDASKARIAAMELEELEEGEALAAAKAMIRERIETTGRTSFLVQ
jgi:hypothetical protein